MNCVAVLCFHLFLTCFLSTHPTIAAQSNSDEQSLIAIKNSITLDPLKVFDTWIPSIHFCNWTGVTCDAAAQKVVSLILESFQLQGTVSPSIGNLTFIKELSLYNNSLSGEIPEELGRLQRLQQLRLSSNELDGPIPLNLTACRDLVRLAVSYNHLTGSTPPQLCRLKKLQVLKLGSNKFTGTIPSSLANLSSLNTLFLETNNLQGQIPPELGQLNELQSLYLFENHLTGPVPFSLSNISVLSELDLDSNNLSGEIPPELGNLAQLQTLYLWGNNLKGNIPISLSNCSQMVQLDLELNHLTGVVPLGFSKLSALEYLSLSSNELVSGSSITIPILSALSNCSQLNELLFHDNNLRGRIPEQLPTNLSVLLLNGNNITGIIPSQIANLTNLTELDLSSNLFTGKIPALLSDLQKLQRLRLDNNKLDGSIPSEIGKIENLGELSLSNNRLSGDIPLTIALLQQLRRLMLHHNQLSGSIPASLGKCYNLELVDLSHNQFTGQLPREVASLPNLQFYFNLSGNSLQGQLPLEIGKMIHVQAIDVSANRLKGHIPATLGSCSNLQHLNLSSNKLQGRIPNDLGNLKSLVDMDLSYNNLSGPIPSSLRNLTMFEYMNLSFNNLSGEIPKEGVFKNLSAASFMGNSFLCGEWMHLPSCSIVVPSGKSNRSKVLAIALAGGAVATVLCSLLIGGLIYFHFQRMSRGNSTDVSTINPIRHTGVSYQEIVAATNRFDGENLLGTGGFGSVYKGILNDGTAAAFKILNMQKEKAWKSFIAECKVLGNCIHRNLVNVITFCSEPENKVLVLQFMSKGNLEKLLFSDGGLSDLSNILNIALDVVHALEYLHHDCSVQVVHCDIKPSNILLDEDMTAHVADFGIAQLICEPDSLESLTSALSLKGSIGYIPPEYGVGGKVSTKGDVYSYGIVLLEMITRKSPTDDMFMGDLNLHKWVSMHFPDRVVEIVDHRVMRDLEEYEIKVVLIPFIHIGLVCSNESPLQRPTAQQVAGALEIMRKNLLQTTVTTQPQTYI
ncbi:LRR receptor-like serine/threonine-protein kinase FLS2 [Cryptomeria japonica]|uniref:LRR receptor-like serine/threonine-protein kinase FLS2 n=1 Tax=Cryptomeria japonica TaxID=3369 RepID=UPI0025AD2EC7|nr:LRR receptor-like serine/threonine-protein kinase FLS2 [Cryptomeria japonica]